MDHLTSLISRDVEVILHASRTFWQVRASGKLQLYPSNVNMPRVSMQSCPCVFYISINLKVQLQQNGYNKTDYYMHVMKDAAYCCPLLYSMTFVLTNRLFLCRTVFNLTAAIALVHEEEPFGIHTGPGIPEEGHLIAHVRVKSSNASLFWIAVREPLYWNLFWLSVSLSCRCDSLIKTFTRSPVYNTSLSWKMYLTQPILITCEQAW